MPFTPDQVLFLDEDNVYGADELGLPFRDIVGEGIVSATDFAVSQRAAGANLSVDVAAGACWIKGDDNATLQPTYRYREAAVTNLAIAAADPTNPRIDLVIAEIRDSTFAGVNKDGRLRVITGTPAGSPVAPALPGNAIRLAEVSVPANDTTITDNQITNKRVRAVVGGVGLGDYRTYVPAWTSSGTAPALGNAVVSARFAQFGKLVHVSFQITFGSTSTFGTGDYFFSLPVSAANLIGSFAPIGTAFSFDTSGAVFNTANVLVFNATTIDMQYNAAWPTGAQAVYGATTPWTWANGDSLTVNAVYEAA